MSIAKRTWFIVTIAVSTAFFSVATAEAKKPDKPGGNGGGGGGVGDTPRYSVVEIPIRAGNPRLSEPDANGVLTIAIDGSESGYSAAAFARVNRADGSLLSYGFLPEPKFVDPNDGVEKNGGSNAQDVNTAGLIVGSAQTFDLDASEISSPSRAYLWNDEGAGYARISLPELPGATYSSARGINSQGDMVGTIQTATGNKAVFWNADTLAVTDLNSLVDEALDWELFRARDINDNGLVTGYGQLNDVDRGFVLDLITQQITAVPLVDPAIANHALRINAEGRVVGRMWDGQGIATGTNPDFVSAYSWEGLGLDPEFLPSITNNTSTAIGLNDADATVGVSYIPIDDPFPSNQVVPTLWEPDDNGIIQAIDLREEIPNKPDYTLEFAIDINNDGWIGAYGKKFHKGKYSRPTLLLMPNSTSATSVTAVPEPRAATLIGIGVLAVLTYSSRRFRTTVCKMTFLLAAISLVPASIYAAEFIPLGDLSGGDFHSQAWGVSADGSVVVGKSHSAGGVGGDYYIEAFRWTQDGGITVLEDLPIGVTESEAYAVTDDGILIVGTVGDEATRWTSEFGWDSLGGPHRGAYGVSPSGHVIVGGPSNGRAGEAWKWTEADGAVGLGDLLGGVFDSTAWAVSADGQTIVGHGASDFGGEAFRWTEADGMIGLGDLPGGNFGSAALDVSADGAVVVGYGLTQAGMEAVRWTEHDGMESLGGRSSQARATSSAGSVIVGNNRPESGNEAFVWDSHHGMRSLQQVLIDGGVDMTGWSLTAAFDISADGNVVVGAGVNPSGNIEAYLARITPVPEPSTVTLAVCALLGLAIRARRTQHHD